MSILSGVLYLVGAIFAGFMVFSLCSNLIYWYENLNTPKNPIPLPKPGPLLCIVKFFISMGGYVLCVALFPFGPFLHRRPAPAPDAESGALPPIILIHGLNNNAAVWLYLGHKLRGAGYNISTYTYSSLFVPLESIINRLDAHISEVERLSPGRKPVIIAHSLGGILTRAWLMRAGNRGRLAGLITIGTPHGGSKLAVLAPGALAKNLLPGSSLIASLREAGELPGFPCTALASPMDEAVLPATNLLPPEEGWKLRISAPVGHFSMLFWPSTARMLLEELNDMDKRDKEESSAKF